MGEKWENHNGNGKGSFEWSWEKITAWREFRAMRYI
jgi:hypothetical protein